MVNLSNILLRSSALLRRSSKVCYRLINTSVLPNVSDEHQMFKDSFQQIVQSLVSSTNIRASDFSNHYNELLQYNVRFGKQLRPKTLMAAYKLLHRNPEAITENDINLCHVMAWCLEMFHVHGIVVDDILDSATHRHGKLCWHRQEHTGLSALHDTFILQNSIFHLLHKYFAHKSYYKDVVELFNTIYWKSAIGQSLDMMSTTVRKGGLDLTTFTVENYTRITTFKTGYYTCYFPVVIAMHMSGTYCRNHEKEKNILLAIGRFFQVYNDFVDCYDDKSPGNDIEEGRCTWLAVMALQKANDEQMKIMEENYGKQDESCVHRIKQVYDELQLPVVYRNAMKEMDSQINAAINDNTLVVPKNIFQYMLQIFRMKKLNTSVASL